MGIAEEHATFNRAMFACPSKPLSDASNTILQHMSVHPINCAHHNYHIAQALRDICQSTLQICQRVELYSG
jgi:hypothetical protein